MFFCSYNLRQYPRERTRLGSDHNFDNEIVIGITVFSADSTRKIDRTSRSPLVNLSGSFMRYYIPSARPVVIASSSMHSKTVSAVSRFALLTHPCSCSVAQTSSSFEQIHKRYCFKEHQWLLWHHQFVTIIVIATEHLPNLLHTCEHVDEFGNVEFYQILTTLTNPLYIWQIGNCLFPFDIVIHSVKFASFENTCFVNILSLLMCWCS